MPNERAYRLAVDRAVMHRIDLERYAAGEVRAMLRFMREVERDVLRKVAALQVDPDLTRGERARLALLERLLRELRVVYAEGYRLLERRALLGLEGLAAFEAEFQTASLRASLSDLDERTAPGGVPRGAAETAILSPTAAQLRAVMDTHPMQGRFLRDVFSDMREAHRERVERELRIGFVEGESVPQLSARVQTASRLNARGAEGVARTAVTHIATEVANETYSLNADLVSEVEIVAVLDSRTTEICRARDGDRHPVDSGPRPPFHYRCRTTISPVLADFPPPRRTTYNTWLRRQAAEVQDDILGPTRGRLFRAGRLQVSQFVARDGSSLTLAQLRRRYPEVFERANVTP